MCYTLQWLNMVYSLKSKFWEKYTFPERARGRFFSGYEFAYADCKQKQGRLKGVPSFGGGVRVGELGRGDGTLTEAVACRRA